MGLRRFANDAAEQLLGYRLTKVRATAEAGSAPPPKPLPPRAPDDAVRPPANPEADRPIKAPVFLLCPVRSGSTLLRAMLNSHSVVHAPFELHFRRLSVNLPTDPVQQAMQALGHTHSDVEHLLWDRLLHRALVRSGKQILVEKTPSNVFVFERLATCWPDARFLFLLRHPLSIARSWHEADPGQRPMDEAIYRTYQYMKYLQQARTKLSGLELRYEDLTADPTLETKRICEFLGVEWEPAMVAYGGPGRDEFVKGIGDWRDKIKTGTVQPGRPLPDPAEVPEEFIDICREWGYLA